MEDKKLDVLNRKKSSRLRFDEKGDKDSIYLALGICIGVTLGIILGSLLGNIFVGIIYGLCFGIVVGTLIYVIQSKH